MGRLYDPKNRRRIKEVYFSWISSNFGSYIRVGYVSSWICITLLIPFDYFLFPGRWQHYLIARSAYIIFTMPFFLMGDWGLRKKSQRLSSLILLLPIVALSYLYLFFMNDAGAESRNVVLIGNLMVVFFSSFFVHRFWREHYFFHLSQLPVIIICALAVRELQTQFVLIAICHLVSAVIGAFFRRMFVGELFEKFELARSVLPPPVARHLVSAPSGLGIAEAFPPKNRFTVCICSDWRGYQELTRKMEPERVALLFEKFYDAAYDRLEQCIGSGNFYLDWTADELFVVVYCTDGETSGTIKQAVEFVAEFCGPMFDQLEQILGVRVLYDVGVAAGYGLLGVQGPKHIKKTTIVAECAGIAKRLQTQAKEERARLREELPPIVMLDREVANFVTENHSLPGSLERVVPTVKDLSSESVYCWKRVAQKTEIKKAA